MRRVLTTATVLGGVGVVETFLILALAKLWLHLDIAQIQSLIFLKLAVAGHLTLFVARARGPFWARPWPAPAMIWSAVATKLLATLLVGFGLGLITAISWPLIAFTWGYCIFWVFVEDAAKLAVYRTSATPGRVGRNSCAGCRNTSTPARETGPALAATWRRVPGPAPWPASSAAAPATPCCADGT